MNDLRILGTVAVLFVVYLAGWIMGYLYGKERE